MFAQVCILAASVVLGQADASEEQAIRDVINQTSAAWNAKDAQAFAEPYSEDADAVNSRGEKVQGKKALEKTLVDRFKSAAFRDSQFKRAIVSIRFLSGTCALVDSTWALSGVRNVNGEEMPVKEGTTTLILMKRDGKWCIVATRSMVPVKE